MKALPQVKVKTLPVEWPTEEWPTLPSSFYTVENFMRDKEKWFGEYNKLSERQRKISDQRGKYIEQQAKDLDEQSRRLTKRWAGELYVV